MTHFADPDVEGVTLCGITGADTIVFRSDTRADCTLCQDLWAARGWAFPLPALVVKPLDNRAGGFGYFGGGEFTSRRPEDRERLG